MVVPAHLIATLRPFIPRLVLMVCSGLVMSLVLLVGPFVAGQFSDLLLIEGSTLDIGVMLIVLFVLASIRALMQYFSTYLAARVYIEMGAALRATVFNRLADLPLGWHQTRAQGEHVSLVTGDVDAIADFVTGTLVQVGPTVMTLLGVGVIIGVQYPFLLSGILLLGPLLYYFLNRTSRYLDGMSLVNRSALGEMYGRTLEYLHLISLLKAYGREPEAKGHVFELNERVVTVARPMQRLRALVSPLTQYVGVLVVLLLLGFGSEQFLRQSMTPGELVSLVLYVLVLVRPASALASAVTELSLVRGALTRLDEAMREPVEASDGKLVLNGVQRSLRFRDVAFAYPGKAQLFSELSLRIAKGSVLGLTGPNGAGKTTLTNLLVRFQQPHAGRIEIDGIDIRELQLSALRQLVAYAQQDTKLLNDTILANVRVGNPEASREQVLAALDLAQSRLLLTGLSDGIDTVVGDNGVSLSGGERQRIGLARVFVSDRPIIVLDEATSMFDVVAEKALVMALRDWLKPRVTILITHRPALLTLADKIVQLKEGRVSRVMNNLEIGL